MSERPKVFISYSHDSKEHEARVQRLAERLRQDGTDCNIDKYEEFPPEGWPAWMRRQLHEADFVLVACTQTYFQRLTEDEWPGVGLGARFEGGLIEQYLYEAKGHNQKFIPILFDGLDVEWIPLVLRRYSYFRVDTEEGYATLFRYLTRQPPAVKDPLKPPDEIEDLTKASRKTFAKEGKAGLSSIGRGLRHRWQWSVAVTLLASMVFAAIWWTRYHQPSRLYDKGRQAMAIRDFPRARIFFEEALAKDDLPVVRSALAEALMRLGMNDPAIKEAESAVKQSEKLPYRDRQLVQARHARIRDNWDEALFRYKELHKREPAEVEYVVGIAEAQIAQAQYTEALSTIEAMQKTSKDPRLDLMEGMASYYISNFPRQKEASSRAIKKAENQGWEQLASEGYLFRGNAFLSLGKLDSAREDFEAAEKNSGGNLQQIALARTSMADVFNLEGNLNRALDYYDGAYEAYSEAGNEQRAHEQKLYIADIYDQQGKLGLARREYETALAQPGDRLLQSERAAARGALGTILSRQGDLIEAAENLGRAISLFGKMGDQEQKAGYSCRLALVHLDSLELDPAKTRLKECLDVARSKDFPVLKADALFSQGYLLVFQGDLERAWKEHQSALEIYTKVGALGDVARSRLALAQIDLERNQALAARSHSQSASDYFFERGALDDLATAQVYLARVFLVQGAPQKTLNMIDEIKRRESESLVLRVRTSLVEAHALAAMGKIAEARQVIQHQLNNDRNRRYPRLRMETRLAQGEIEILYGDRNQGRELLSLVEEEARERGFKLAETKAARLRAGS